MHFKPLKHSNTHDCLSNVIEERQIIPGILLKWLASKMNFVYALTLQYLVMRSEFDDLSDNMQANNNNKNMEYYYNANDNETIHGLNYRAF